MVTSSLAIRLELSDITGHLPTGQSGLLADLPISDRFDYAIDYQRTHEIGDITVTRTVFDFPDPDDDAPEICLENHLEIHIEK